MSEHLEKYKSLMAELKSKPHFQNASMKNQNIMMQPALKHLMNHRRFVNGKPIIPVKE